VVNTAAGGDESADGGPILGAGAYDPLTTKEGWRRFVDRQPQPLALHDTATLAALSADQRERYDEARRGYHADLPLVNTPTIQKVIATARLMIQLNRHQVSARRGVIISGASGTGKTTALTLLGRTHERHTRRRHPNDRYRLPAMYVTVPPAATPRMLAVEFARFLGLQFRTRANITDIVEAVCTTAARTRVELVCVDELHNLNLASRSGAEASDQLKYFAERLPVTFAYAGIDVEDAGLFAGVRGRQIAGRFTVIDAAAFPYGTGEQRAQWRALIATMESALRLHHHKAGTLVRLAEYLYRRSGGMIGSLSQLVRGAAILAIDDGSERITKALLEDVPVDLAAQRAHTSSRSPRQPRTRSAG
jgi:DNA transposition AAA+ family ATPase